MRNSIDKSDITTVGRDELDYQRYLLKNVTPNNVLVGPSITKQFVSETRSIICSDHIDTTISTMKTRVAGSNFNTNINNDHVVLMTKLFGDVLIATSVTALAAPFLTIIDKALVQRSASSQSNTQITVWSSMRNSCYAIIQNPIQFIRSPTFIWMWGTYAMTYTAANTLRTIMKYNESKMNTINDTGAVNGTVSPKNNTSSNTTLRSNNNMIYLSSSTKSLTQPRPNILQPNSKPKYQYYFSSSTTLLIGTSIVNSTASILKDRAYAQLYGNNNNNNNTSTKRVPIPKITYGLWLLRDVTVIGAAFVLPNYVAQFIKQQQQVLSLNTSNNSKNNTSYTLSDTTISRIAQIGTPVMAQIIAGPLHFIGYDYYNHRNTPTTTITSSSSFNTSMQQFHIYERLNNLRNSLGQVIVARMIRIVPGYGIAGIFNTELLSLYQKNIIDPMIVSHNNNSSSSSLSHELHPQHDTNITAQQPNITTPCTTYWEKLNGQHHDQKH